MPILTHAPVGNGVRLREVSSSTVPGTPLLEGVGVRPEAAQGRFQGYAASVCDAMRSVVSNGAAIVTGIARFCRNNIVFSVGLLLGAMALYRMFNALQDESVCDIDAFAFPRQPMKLTTEGQKCIESIFKLFLKCGDDQRYCAKVKEESTLFWKNLNNLTYNKVEVILDTLEKGVLHEQSKNLSGEKACYFLKWFIEGVDKNARMLVEKVFREQSSYNAANRIRDCMNGRVHGYGWSELGPQTIASNN